jgi:hypothetical protein
VGEIRNTSRILVEKLEWKIPFVMPRCRQEASKWILKKRDRRAQHRLDSCDAR